MINIAIRIATATILIVASMAPAMASPAAEAVSLCLTDSTTGKDRKDLARWIFLAMAEHPEIREFAKVPTAAGDESARAVASLFTRLIVDNCPKQIEQLVQADGPESLSAAFGFLGKVAFQELVTNEQVSRSIQQYQRYIDRAKLDAALAPR